MLGNDKYEAAWVMRNMSGNESCNRDLTPLAAMPYAKRNLSGLWCWHSCVSFEIWAALLTLLTSFAHDGGQPTDVC